MTVSDPITSLLSSVPTPWVNEAKLTPSYPPKVPALAVREAGHYHHKEREASSPGGAWGPHFQSSSSHNCVPRGKTQPSVKENSSQPALFFPDSIPHQMLLFTGPQLLPVLPYLTLPDGQTVLLECRSYFYHSLHNHFLGWICGLRCSSYLQGRTHASYLAHC